MSGREKSVESESWEVSVTNYGNITVLLGYFCPSYIIQSFMLHSFQRLFDARTRMKFRMSLPRQFVLVDLLRRLLSNYNILRKYSNTYKSLLRIHCACAVRPRMRWHSSVTIILITFEANLKMHIKATKYLMQVEIVRVFKQSVIHYINKPKYFQWNYRYMFKAAEQNIHTVH